MATEFITGNLAQMGNDQSMRGIGITTNKVAKERCYMKMGPSMMVNGRKEHLMDLVSISILKVILLKGNG